MKFFVDVQQTTTRTYEVVAANKDDAKARYPDGLVIHSETGPEAIIGVEGPDDL